MHNKSQVNSLLKKHILWDDEAVVIDLVASQGSWLVDANTGRTLLDCFSQFASQPVGWNHPKVLEHRKAFGETALHKIANSDMATDIFAEFTEAFASITQDFQYLFFIDGGALAVENALKTAFDWKHQRDGTDIQAMDVVHLRDAFHGRTGYTMSLTNSSASDYKTKYFPKFEWSRVHNPTIHHTFDQDIEAEEEKSLNQMLSALQSNNVAAIIMEPIQGEGGDNHFRKKYFEQVRALADEHNALLIFDEVQTGLGLTGEMWAHEHFVKPDIICFGKKSQVCGIAVTDRIDDVPDNVFHAPWRINSTWGGNNVDMLRSKILIDIIKDDMLVDNAYRIGNYFLESLQSLGLENARGRGLMLAFDLSNEAERDSLLKRLSEKMLALSCGEKSIRFRPHLTFSEEDVDCAIGFIKEVV